MFYLNWFESYLTKWKQTVTINGVTGNESFLNSRLPQSSVLGPLLFIL